MQSVEPQFRDKVFDEEVLNFCLVLIEFLEKMPGHSTMLRRVVLDALTVSSSLKEVSVFIKSLNTLPLVEFSPHMESFLDASIKLSENKIALVELLTTVRHLAERSDYKNWQVFFAGISILGNRALLVEDFFMTFRHLAGRTDFTSWDDFHAGISILGDRDAQVIDYLMTVRHMVIRTDFQGWQGHFDGIRVVGDRAELVEDFFMTFRHLAGRTDFTSWDDFHTGISILGDRDAQVIDYLMTVRHMVECADFKDWNDFFTSVGVVGHNDTLVDNLMMSVRHLVGSPDFKNWGDLFKIVRILGENQSSLQSSLVVARELSDTAQFKGWEDFGKCVAIFGHEERSLEDLLVTIRHLVAKKDFTDWEAFFGALKVMAEQKERALSDFLIAVRHAINYFHSSDSLKSIFRTMAMVPQYSEACAFGQLDSKQWLIQEAQRAFGNDWGRVFVLAGWIGFLPRLIFDAGITVTGVRSFDIDENSGLAAESLNQSLVQQNWIFKSSTKDITQMTYPSTFTVRRKDGSGCELFEMPELVINTSCEHIADISSWWDQIPKGMRVIVQSNDAFHITEHVRCFKTLAEFEAAMNMSQVDYRGEKRLADFNRFMLIGRK